MDPRRLLILAVAGLALPACAVVRAHPQPQPKPQPHSQTGEVLPVVARPDILSVAADAPGPALTDLTASPPVVPPNPVEPAPERPMISPPRTPTGLTGRSAIAAANAEARIASRADHFVGGEQVFAWAPGRVYEIWTAPLRVTTLTLAPGETLIAKAAGDTVRWQIGDSASGAGASARAHVLIKPIQAGLETNLVLTTNRRVYLIQLRSGGAEAFNAAVTWDHGLNPDPIAGPAVPDTRLVQPTGRLNAGYRILPRGRVPRWAPRAVFDDGARTFIVLPEAATATETPAVFVVAGGEAELVNYRQADGLIVIDRLFDEAELRVGDRHPRIVRILRRAGATP